MATLQVTLPTTRESEKAIWNGNQGGGIRQKTSFTVAAGDAFAVCRATLTAGTTLGEIDSAIIPGINAIAEVDAVVGDVIYGESPVTIDALDEGRLYVEQTVSYPRSRNGETWVEGGKSSSFKQVAENKKWIVFAVDLGAEPDNTNMTAFIAGVDALINIGNTKVYVDRKIPADADSAGTVGINVHYRIETIEV